MFVVVFVIALFLTFTASSTYSTVKVVDSTMKKYRVVYQTYVQNIGWQKIFRDSEIAGTFSDLRLESVAINLYEDYGNTLKQTADIEYSGFVGGYGWETHVNSGSVLGKTGKSLENLKINLRNQLSTEYDILYRVYTKNGWHNWKKNNELASLNNEKINGLQIKLEKKLNLERYVSDKVYSHRGASGERVEHTIPAYDLAIEQGSKNIELDVVISKNGTLWVSHDLTAKAMTLVDKKYSDMTDEEISKLRITKLKTKEDLSILKVEDVFNRYGNNVNYVIETKPWQNQDRKLINMIKEQNLQKNVVYQTVQDNISALELVKKEIPEVQTMLLLVNQEHLNRAVKFKDVDIIGAYFPLLSRENVKLVHENGKKFNVWTLNKEEEIKKALLLNVDSYFTDFTGRGISVEKSLYENK